MISSLTFEKLVRDHDPLDLARALVDLGDLGQAELSASQQGRPSPCGIRIIE
jgi:hypothetical protein